MKMRRHGAVFMLLSLLVSATAQTNQPRSSPVQNPQTISIIRNGSLPSQKGPAEYFTGSVRVDPLIQAIAPSRLSGGSVTFEPGARTAWHTHPVGQTLIVTAGVGRVQSWGGPVEEIRTGDVARIPPNVKHWHGASPTVAMTHIALLEQLDGKSVEWMEKVSDAQYGAALGGAQQPAPNINTGHAGTFAHPGGGWFAEVAAAWLKWTLNGDNAAGFYFKGKNCKLCLNPIWNIERKNFGS